MLDWLDAIPNLGVPGVAGVQPHKSAGFTGTPHKLAGVPGVPTHCRRTPGTPGGTPVSETISLKIIEEHREHLEHRKSDNPSLILREWHRHLSALDDCRTPAGFTLNSWQRACDDARWIYENFASPAVRDGWTAADLFGLWPDKPGWGGIADRLQGSRSLVMDADRAHWRAWGQVERFNRGSYPDLHPVWELV